MNDLIVYAGVGILLISEDLEEIMSLADRIVVMAAGTAAGGWRIIRTLGHKMVKLQPVHGFALDLRQPEQAGVELIVH